MSLEILRSRPLLPLVEAFLSDAEQGPSRLGYLCLSSARRALPAWTHYCAPTASFHGGRVGVCNAKAEVHFWAVLARSGAVELDLFDVTGDGSRAGPRRL